MAIHRADSGAFERCGAGEIIRTYVAPAGSRAVCRRFCPIRQLPRRADVWYVKESKGVLTGKPVSLTVAKIVLLLHL